MRTATQSRLATTSRRCLGEIVRQHAHCLHSSPFVSTRLTTRNNIQPHRQSRVQMKAMSMQSVAELPGNLKKIVGAFQMVPDPMARYKQLLYFATKLAPLEEQHHLPENKVEGCVSQVWVHASLDNGVMSFKADSDSQLTKGLAALLVQGLSGCTPAEILSLQPDFIEMLGLKQNLTPSRNNGFLNMLKHMQRKTLQLASQDLKSEGKTEAVPANGLEGSTPSQSSNGNGHIDSSSPVKDSLTPIQDSIRMKLTEGLKPSVLNIVDESAQHSGHAAMAGRAGGSGESHFKVSVVSTEFEGVNTVKRHRMVYGLLKDELAGPVHALSLETKSPSE